jgi:hypothetical protein
MPGQPLTVRPLPFPHLAADGLWDGELLRQVAAEFPAPDVPGWKRYENSTERKLEGPPGLWKPDLEEAFGIPGLEMETVGGGYHLIPPGGYLAVHADFNRSPHTGRYRRLNHLIYLNDGWDDGGGALELWDETGPAVTVAPEMNRTVVFETSDRSWHGHPRPAARWRKSVAAYFFTGDPPAGYAGEHSTLWHEAVSA